MKKFLASFLCVVLLCTSFALPVMAATTQKVTAEQGRSGVARKEYWYTITKSNAFSKAWKKDTQVTLNVSGMSYPAKIIYGYDTFVVKEDFINKVGGFPTGCKCKGEVINGNGSNAFTSEASAGKLTGKADIKHSGTTASYRVRMWFV